MSSAAWTNSTIARLNYLRVAVAGAYVCGILSSAKLWFGLGRTIPRVPFVTGLPDFLLSTDYVLTILLVAALALSLLTRRPRRYLVLIVIFTFLLVLVDQTRLQPWVYQYVVMLAVLACWNSLAADINTPESVLLANQLVIALLYFWSGIQKLNWSFTHEAMPDLLSQAGVSVPDTFASYLPVVGFAVAMLEALIGVGLIIRRTRQTAVILALVMHVLVLVLLVAAQRNSVVWVWNIAMMAMVVLLFWRCEQSLARKELWRWRETNLVKHLPKVVAVICGLTPALSFVGWWDMYLSAALYSGNTPVAVVHISEGLRNRLPAVAERQVFSTSSGELMLPYYEWSMADLNVPPYPETRVYRQLARQLCRLADNSSEIELIVKERPSLIEGRYTVGRFGCRSLLAVTPTEPSDNFEGHDAYAERVQAFACDLKRR